MNSWIMRIRKMAYRERERMIAMKLRRRKRAKRVRNGSINQRKGKLKITCH